MHKTSRKKILTGKVFSGMAIGREKIMLLNKSIALQKVAFLKTAAPFYPGTLNVRLPKPWNIPLKKIIRIEKEEYKGDAGISFVKCRVKNPSAKKTYPAFIARPDLTAYNKKVLEIIAETDLRKLLNLSDNSEINIIIF